MPVNINDVADRAGVSTATVSRVLNGEKYVSNTVREKVTTAIEDLNYSPNYLARSLVVKQTKLIGVLISDISSSYFSTILTSIEQVASTAGYSIMLCNINKDLEKEKTYLDTFKRLRIDGLLLMHEEISSDVKDKLSCLGCPIVTAGIKIMGTPFPSVNIDNIRAAYDAVNYLISCGHKKIAYFGSTLDEVSTGMLRYNGTMRALEDNGLSFSEEYVKLASLKMSNGYRLMKEVLTLKEHPTAIFCGNDDMAVGALNCILDNGFTIPGDFSVAGFDDSLLAMTIRPKLTTIHQPIQEIGDISAKMLIDLIENRTPTSSEIILPHQLMIRDSSGSPTL